MPLLPPVAQSFLAVRLSQTEPAHRRRSANAASPPVAQSFLAVRLSQTQPAHRRRSANAASPPVAQSFLAVRLSQNCISSTTGVRPPSAFYRFAQLARVAQVVRDLCGDLRSFLKSCLVRQRHHRLGNMSRRSAAAASPPVAQSFLAVRLSQNCTSSTTGVRPPSAFYRFAQLARVAQVVPDLCGDLRSFLKSCLVRQRHHRLGNMSRRSAAAASPPVAQSFLAVRLSQNCTSSTTGVRPPSAFYRFAQLARVAQVFPRSLRGPEVFSRKTVYDIARNPKKCGNAKVFRPSIS